MFSYRPVLIGLLAATALYLAGSWFSDSTRPKTASMVSTDATPAPGRSVAPGVGAKVGAKYGDKSMTPTLTPTLVTVAPTSVVTPVPRISLTPWPTATATSTLAASPIISPRQPTPRPSVSSVAIPTPSVSSSPVATAADSTPSHVVINEIAWMGTATSSSDEWIELYNAGTSPVALSGWHLKADDGKPDIVLAGTVAPGSYYLIERTDDSTVSDIPADLVASFGTGLSNSGENLKLVDSAGTIADSVDCSGGWYAGDSAQRISMERINAGIPGNSASNWATNNGSLTYGKDVSGAQIKGTPGYPNSVS